MFAQSPCLVIDDQGRFAQIARLENGRIAAGAKLLLVGVKPSKDTIGRPQFKDCSGGVGKFKDIDGEAVAYSSPFFYVVGSHGCSRHSNKFRSSSFILARIPEAGVVSALSDPAFIFDPSSVQTTYRLSEALAAAPQVRHYFTKDLMSANGLNIEGLVVYRRQAVCWLAGTDARRKGFHCCNRCRQALRSRRADKRKRRAGYFGTVGAGRGVRDLAWLKDGRLLVLSGSAQDAQLPFEIHVLNFVDGTTTLLGDPGRISRTRQKRRRKPLLFCRSKEISSMSW